MNLATVKRDLQSAMNQLLYDVGVPMVSPPHGTKRRIIVSYATRHGTRTLVETGTFMGDMVARMQPHVRTIHSIELSEPLYRKAVERFRGVDQVQLHCGDSATKLATVLATTSEPCLFWLDAHYSGGPTARAAKDTPIMEELRLIFDHQVRDHVILVDDARLFVGADSYPTLDELRAFVAAHRPDYDMTVKEDVIRLVPPMRGTTGQQSA